MNKTTTLVLAAIAGFGLCAQARTTTNDLWNVSFDEDATSITEPAVPFSSVTNAITVGRWTIAEDDESCVTTNRALGEYGTNFVLELNTQGNELKWTPDETGDGSVSIIESDIYFVGADDPPADFDSEDSPAQTALYLRNNYDDGDEPSSYTLCVWTADGSSGNHWQDLDSVVTSETWCHVQVLIDYGTGTPKVSVSVGGIVAKDPEDATVSSWTAANYARENPPENVQTVSFKGTGKIDNFVGKSKKTEFDKAYFGVEVYVDNELQPVGSTGNTTRYTLTKKEIGDADDDARFVKFEDFKYDNFNEDTGDLATVALSKVTIITNGISVDYGYSQYYVREVPDFQNVPEGYPVVFDLDTSSEMVGTFSISPLTHGATDGDVTNIVAKIYISTLDAYYANEVVTVGATTVTNATFVKPSDCPADFTNVYPASTNVNETAYVLSSVKVAGGATVAFANDQATVSFLVADQLPADTTYVEATYVPGTYDADAVDWGYNEDTGKYEFKTKTFTVTWMNGVQTLATYTNVPYGTTTPAYAGETPTKAEDAANTYVFKGWDPEVATTVTADATYTAQFTAMPKGTVIVITANGATTNYFATLPLAFAAAADGETVALLANVNLDGRVFVNAGATPTYSANGRYATSSDNRSLTLDLNGHCITNSSNIALAGGSLTITNTSDTASVIATTASGLAPVEVRGTGDLASKRTLAVGPNVTLSGPCYGLNVFGSNDTQLNKIDVTVDGTVDGMLFVLGNLKNTANEINVVVNGTVDASNAVGEEKVHTGIAQAGYSTVTVNDGAVVTGESGIETRAGSLVVNGGTITATAPASSYEANGSGMTTKGAAIAVAQHGTALPMSTTLNGGTLSGAESIVVTDVNDNNLGNVEVVATENFAEDATVPEGYSWIEDEVTGDYVLTKVWVVTYANYDGTALQVTTNVTGATTPAYAGATPVKPDDATYTYAFTGWSPAAAATVTADATYTAQFSATEKPQGTILVISANGAVTNLSETLAAAVAAVEDGGKIVLTDDQNAGASRIQVSNKSFTVDLNGQTLSSSEADNIIFRVSGGQTIQIEGTTPGSTFVGSVMIAGSTEGHIAVNGGTYTNDLYCPFYANGTCSAASSIAITNATIVAVDAEAGQPGADSETGFGLYVAGPAATTLKDTTIVADKTGVEIRAGSLVVDGGSITAGDTFSTAANGNGGTVYGAAISVSPHNTNKPIAVEVNGGTFTAAKAVYENYLQPQARTAETAVTLNGGSFIGEVDIVEDIGTVIPSTSTALFSDSDADGVPAGYRLVADGETGLYKVVEIVPYLELMTDTMYINCTNFARVVDAPAGSTYRFKLTPDSVAGYNRSSNWDMAKPYGKAPGTATLTYYVTNNNEQVALFSTNITVKDVYAVVDGVEYSSAQWTNAVAAALENDKVLEIYKAKASVALAAGQSLRWKYIGTKSNGSGSSVNCTVPAATSSAVYAVTKTTDPLTGVTTSACTSSAPSVMITKADGSVTYANEFNFETANSTNKVLRSFSSGRQTVNVLNATLDLNGCTVTFAETDYVAITVGSSSWKTGSLTIKDTSVAGTGKIVSASDGIDVAYNASSVTIEGGAIEAVTSAVYLMNANASATISGGSFKVTSGEATYLLNMLDSARGTITVTGGSFYGFDPMNNTAEGAGTDFVDPAYATVADSPSAGWYTVVPAFTVTWNDEDDTALETDTRVATGVTPSFDGETPAKASTAQYDYAFDAWTPAIAAVESNTVYTATYTETLRTYTITWANYDNTVLDTDEVAYGETPEYTGETPTKPNDGDTEFEFDGWSPAIVAVEGAATYVAQFKEKAADDHIGAKSENGFVILAPEDADYETSKPLTFAAPDLTAGTVQISASMVAPDSGTTATLKLLYKTSLTGDFVTPAPEVTISAIDTTAGTATVTLPANLPDTVFFFGFSNEASVVDKTSEP